MRSGLLATWFLSMLLLAGTPASADVIFSNLGTGDSYLSTGISINPSSQVALAFTPTDNALFGQVELPIWRFFSNSNGSVIVKLAADSGGNPGTIIEDLGTHSATQFLIGNPGVPSSGFLVTAASTLQPALLAGTQYWIVVSAGAGDTDALWLANNTLNTNPTRNNFQNTGWLPANPTLAMRVSDVPEPVSLVLLGLGSVAFLRRGRSA